MDRIKIIGGGLAGCEAAWQVAKRGVSVDLYEMRPHNTTGAHTSSFLSELVCSNSLGSALPDRPSGMLIHEMEKLDSLIIQCARKTQVPAGRAFAVDRWKFAEMITNRLSEIPNIRIIRDEVTELPEGICIIATGPLTSPTFSEALQKFTGLDNLFFFDAIAPTAESNSVDMSIAFKGSRYGDIDSQEGDYINCPFTKEQYDLFVEELISAERFPLKDFEMEIDSGVKAGKGKFFEGCLPIEVMAGRGHRTLAFGPLRPTGLSHFLTGIRPYAVAQLRREDLEGRYLNLVGFQTNLRRKEQERVFRLIPGLEKAVFTRFGQMHKNTYLHSPGLLNAHLQTKNRPNCFIAGQVSGVEGYLASTATGLLAGINAVRFIQNDRLLELPAETMLGALCREISNENDRNFQPVKESFGLLPPLDDNEAKNKKLRHQKMAERESKIFDEYISNVL